MYYVLIPGIQDRTNRFQTKIVSFLKKNYLRSFVIWDPVTPQFLIQKKTIEIMAIEIAPMTKKQPKQSFLASQPLTMSELSGVSGGKIGPISVIIAPTSPRQIASPHVAPQGCGVAGFLVENKFMSFSEARHVQKSNRSQVKQSRAALRKLVKALDAGGANVVACPNPYTGKMQQRIGSHLFVQSIEDRAEIKTKTAVDCALHLSLAPAISAATLPL